MQKVMVVDTDAHQGNGYARDKLQWNDHDLFIVDLYNAGAQRSPHLIPAGVQLGQSLGQLASLTSLTPFMLSLGRY